MGRRRKYACDLQRNEGGIGRLSLGLGTLEEVVVFDGIVDRRRGKQRVETTRMGGGVVLVKDGLDDGVLGQRLADLGGLLTFRLVVIHVEAEDVPVLDGVGDGVGVQLSLEQVDGGAHRRLIA